MCEPRSWLDKRHLRPVFLPNVFVLVDARPLVFGNRVGPKRVFDAFGTSIFLAHETREDVEFAFYKVEGGALGEACVGAAELAVVARDFSDCVRLEIVRVEIAEVVLVALPGKNVQLAGMWIEQHRVSDA